MGWLIFGAMVLAADATIAGLSYLRGRISEDMAIFLVIAFVVGAASFAGGANIVYSDYYQGSCVNAVNGLNK